MNATELINMLLLLKAPVGEAKPTLTQIAKSCVERGYQRVWGAFWWLPRQANTELTCTAGQAYVELPTDYEQGYHLRREGTTDNEINVVSPQRFYKDHPYPEGENSGVVKEATVLHNTSWKPHEYRLYLYPLPDVAYTLPLIYLRKGDVGELQSLPSYMLDAIVAASQYAFGIITKEEELAAVREGISNAGVFVVPSGRNTLTELADLFAIPGAPGGFFGESL